MKEASLAVEYLCYRCGTQGLAQAPAAADEAEKAGLRCPRCGKPVTIASHPFPGPSAPAELAVGT